MSLSREQILREMGITPLWREREPGWGVASGDAETGAQATGAPAEARASANERPAQTERPTPAAMTPPARPAAALAQRQAASPARPAHAPAWPEFSATALADEAAAPASPMPHDAPSATFTVDTANWAELAAGVAACRQCELCKQRKQAVLGVGDVQADWLFIGEGPGADEDIKGEPFVGQAGKLLDNMLAALDLKRSDNVYIANAVKCRPPGNRTPEPAEMAACRPYLERQIALIQPKVIVLLGKPAAHTILGLDMQKALGPLRGHRHEYLLGDQPIPVIVTYHPAYLLRNLPDKARAWEDLLYARRILREETADQQQEALF